MHPTGPNTVTFEQPYLFTLNIIIMVLVALPSLVLAIYDYMSFRISSAILQFLGLSLGSFIIDIIAHTIYTFTLASFITSIILFASAIITLAIGGKSFDKNDSH